MLPYTTEKNVIDLIRQYLSEHKQGTTVVANPPIGGDETPLVGIQVDNTKYSCKGTQLYIHYFQVPSMLNTSFYIINDKSAPYTNLVEQDNILEGKFCTPGRYQKIIGIVYTPDGHKLCLLDYSPQSSGPVMQINSIVDLTGLSDTVIEL